MDLLIILALTLANSFFAMCEAALLSVNKSRIEHLAAQKNKKAGIVLSFIENPENFLSTVQVGITLIGIVSGVFGGTVLAGDMRHILESLGINSEFTENLSVVIVVVLITYFTIVIGELVPKSFAINHADRISLMCAPVMKFLTSVTYPAVKLLSGSTSFILKSLRIKEKKEEHLSEEELKYMLQKAEMQGILEKDESKIHRKIFSFSDQVAKSLMTPRTDLDWLDINSSKNEMFKQIRESAHSKFPVCDGNPDNLLGILYVKDFLDEYNNEEFDIRDILRRPILLNQYTPAFSILNEFRKKKEYIGIVVDEHGEIDGVLTLHDMIEAVMGDLPDIDEPYDPDIVKRSRFSYLINGKATIFEINDYFGMEVIEDDPHNYTTLSGYVLHKLGEIPKTGRKIFDNGITLEVVDMDGKRIDRILFEITDQDLMAEIPE